MTMWQAVTSLGDSALLLPLIAWLAIGLYPIDRRPRDALRWLLAAIACGGIVALSKLLFMGGASGLPGSTTPDSAASRLALEVHSLSEVVLGAVVGVASATWFIRGAAPSRQAHAWMVACGALLIGVFCYGRVFPSQHLLQDVAMLLSGHADVFVRR